MRPAHTVRRVARGLAVPPGARLRVLEELHADLEDMEATLRAAGVGPEEARRRAAALLAPGEEALAALATLHRPWWVRWSAWTASPGQRRAGVLLSALVLLGAVLALREALALPDLPLLLVPLAGIGAAALVHAAARAVRIWGFGEVEAARARADTGDLLIAAAGAAIASAFGVLLELYGTAAAVVADPASELALVVNGLRRSVVLGAAGMAVALPCGLAWLFFVHRASGFAVQEQALLGPELHLAGGNGSAGSDAQD